MVTVGSTVGSYELLDKVGQGAMGAVWLARQPHMGKRVALKVIRPELSNDEDVVTRFFNEARAVTLIGHPNIVEVQDFGQTPDGESFIVMELLEGETLGQALRGGPLAIDRAVAITIQITEGLGAAHARGIVHRDLKPDNVFLVRRPDGGEHVKILDFGLAKLSGPGALQHNTRTGTVLGTPHYMAPEGAEGSRHVDHRADVYALGCLLFQMVAGSVPFPGEGFGEVLVRHVREEPPRPSRLRPDTPPWLDKIILHALAKKPDKRFASMDEFGRALCDEERWGRDVDVEELARNTRLMPAPMRAAVAPTLHADPGDAVTPRPVRSPTVLAKDAPTRISDRPPQRAERDLLAMALFVIAGLTLATAIAWRFTHAHSTRAATTPAPAVTAAPPPTTVPLPPTAALPPSAQVAPASDLPAPAPSVAAPKPPPAELPPRSPPAHTGKRPTKPKPLYHKDGVLLAPTW